MSELRPFKAKIAGQCADGGPHCGNIAPGDLIVRRETPAKFDRAQHQGYYELWYSHAKCHEEAEARRPTKAAARKEQGE